MTDIFGVVVGVLAEYIDCDRKISLTDRLRDDLGLCSFDVMQAIAILENKLGNEADLSNIPINPTVGDLVNIFG